MSSPAASAPKQDRWYSLTEVPPSVWQELSEASRNAFIDFFWVLTLCGLVLGFRDSWYWKLVIVVTLVQTLISLALVGFRPLVFPVQLRIAYLAWVSLGTYVEALWILMPITTLGLIANLSFGYCPLARMLSLLPWNRTLPWSWWLFSRTLLQAPGPGRFRVSVSRRR